MNESGSTSTSDGAVQFEPVRDSNGAKAEIGRQREPFAAEKYAKATTRQRESGCNTWSSIVFFSLVYYFHVLF